MASASAIKKFGTPSQIIYLLFRRVSGAVMGHTQCKAILAAMTINLPKTQHGTQWLHEASTPHPHNNMSNIISCIIFRTDPFTYRSLKSCSLFDGSGCRVTHPFLFQHPRVKAFHWASHMVKLHVRTKSKSYKVQPTSLAFKLLKMHTWALPTAYSTFVWKK